MGIGLDLKEGKIGSAGEYSIEFKSGKLRVTVGYDGDGVDGGVYIDLDPVFFLDKLAAAIPGEYDDFVLNALKSYFSSEEEKK